MRACVTGTGGAVRAAVKISLVAATIVVAATSTAHAQRGELAAHVERESSQLDGFPGTFNAAMPARDEWRLDVGLTPGLSYGVHADASVRVSIVPVASWAQASPGGSGELRFRIWHDRRYALVGSFGGMLTRFEVKDETVEARAIKATLTGEFRYSRRTAFALTVLAGGASLISNGYLDDMTTPVNSGGTLQGVGAMLSYSVFPVSWFGLDVGVGMAPVLQAAMVGTGGTMAIDLDSMIEASHGLGGRLAFYVKPGRTWLINVGTVVLPPAVPVPVLGVSKRW